MPTEQETITLLQTELRAIRQERDDWRLLAQARDKLLVAYRIGKTPSEKVFATIERLKRKLGD